MNLLTQFLRSINIAKKLWTNTLTKFWSWVKKKNIYFYKETVPGFDNDEEKVGDHCHVTGKFRGAAHCDCNINFQLTKKFPVIFHNLRGYDSHLIFNELEKFDGKISITKWVRKKMVFFLIRA